MFVLQNAPSTALNLEGLSLSSVGVAGETAKFDLILFIHEGAEGLSASLQYSTDLFNPETITRMLGHFDVLLESMVSNPNRRISELPILTAAEKHQLLVEWNATKKEYPNDKCIHELFEEQAERTPDAIAVVYEDNKLTYRELNQHANQVARYLMKSGVRPEKLVAICMERSLEMIVGILGIMKAGGAYVPLDPEYPKDRLGFMLEDTQAPILLTQKRLVEKVPEHHLHVVCLDRDCEQIATESIENPNSGATAENLSYVMYTSGSTGKPKAVMIGHHNVSRLFRATESWFHFSENDVWTMFHSYAFDFSVWEIWGALLYGGRVVIVPFWISRSPEKFYELLGQEKVTVLNQTPSAFRQLIQADQSLSNQTEMALRLIIFGGEALDFQSLQPWLDRHGDQYPQLVNMYGITETTVHVTHRVVRATDVKQGVGSLIGVPLPDLDLYVLDKQGQLVPIGIAGELYVGGAGVGRGYLNRPELTDERFIANPFNERKADKLYKTGDLVRRLSNGDLEYLGRTDAQVKIRGFRIELGEIESALAQHPGVQEVTVLAREDVPGEKRLVAYVVLSKQQVLTSTEIRTFVKAKLPDYIVPSVFVFLDSLPLTPNGKVDRKALPVPDGRRLEQDENVSAPRTPIEEMLAGIWAEVLKLETIGIHDNFFDLGGHSLLATQVMSRLRGLFQVELPLRNLFESPTVAGLAEGIEDARREQQHLLGSPIVPVPRESELPLSFAQERLWFLDQLEPGSTVYNMPGAFRLTGRLDTAALERSLNKIVRRHETLRTTFRSVDGSLHQVVAAQLGLPLPVIDLSDRSESECENEARVCAAEAARRPFDLSRGPLVRTTLLRLRQEEHILLLNMHHIVSDGWSMAILFRELADLYEAYTNGKPSPLAELPIQYVDYAVWQRNWLRGEVLETQLSYWKKQLENISILNLPTDRPRPAVQSFHGARESLVLSTDLTQALKATSRKEGATLFMTLLAAFQILLHRLTGQDDIAVGSPIAGRNRSEVEGLIGFFINTLVLRADLSGNPTFTELLARVRLISLDAYAHQDVPFEKLLEELRPERDRSRTPLFQVFFNMVNTGENGTFNLPGLTKEPLQFHGAASKFDLTLYTRERNGALWFSLVYNPDLFEPATIARLLGYYHTLLLAIAANSQQPISALPLLTKRERIELSARRNSVAPTNPFVEFKKEDIEQSIPARFEQIVNLHRDRIAVKTTNYQWTYAELNTKANEIAQAILRSRGSAEGRIGLLFEHDAPMIAAILGVLKAGKTYVPLDPAYPPERLSYILEDSQATAITTNSSNVALAHRLINGSLHLINIDEFEYAALVDNFSLSTSPEMLSYILYTSGSTGRPKGVMQSHRNVLHHIRNYTNNLHLNSDDRLTLFSSYGFDAAVMDIFGALLNGAALHPMDIKEEDPSSLLYRLVKENITIYHSTPTVYRYLMSTLAGGEDLSRVRLVVLGGEAVHKEEVDRFKKIFSTHSIFVNGLGPTESTVALQYFIDYKTEIAGNIVPVGYPVEDTEVLLLNEAGQDAEVYGEIAIKSEHVALGYWRKPELTEAAFFPDSESATKRIYRTGDIGRLLPDGSIAFVTRKDDQVKIRGYRIEPGEIESVLSVHPGVSESVVIAREVADEKQLVAYLVARTEPAPPPGELRSFVKAKLPDYMVPSLFVFLDSLPLTPNGKVDRRALPVPDGRRLEQNENVSAPRTPVEEMLEGIWAEVLKLETISIHDNFFDLGGHSLLATQVMSRLRELFEIELALRSLFESPTVAGLAESIEDALREQQHFFGVPIVPVPKESELPLSFSQERLWFLDQLEPGSSVYNISTQFRVLGQLDGAALERSLNEILRRHEALRTTFKSVDGVPRQVIASDLALALPVIDLSDRSSSADEEEARRYAAEFARRPFDLNQGPLVRAALLCLGEEEHNLLLSMHHIISDGWSMAIFFRELADPLRGLHQRSEPSPLAELPIQYVDYAVWQRNWLRGEVLETQLSYWRKQLSNIIPILNLPTDRPRPAIQSFHGARESLVLSRN